MTERVRNLPERVVDARRKLERDLDVWVASAWEGRAHLVPLSLAWDGSDVIVATPTQTLTVANVAKTGRARLMLGTSRDVVMIDAAAKLYNREDAPPDVAESYVDRTGWNPLEDIDVPWTYLVFEPRRIQVWGTVAEMEGRLVMKSGEWLA